MIQDAQLQVSNAQAVTASAASTDYLDLGPLTSPAGFSNANRDLGAGEDVTLKIQVTEGVTAAGAATVTFAIDTDDNTGFSTPTTIYQSVAIPKASLGINTIPIDIIIPRANVERYLRVVYTVATGPLTAGKFSAWFGSSQFQDRKTYTRGYNVG